MVGISIEALLALLIVFPIMGWLVGADMKNPSLKPWRERRKIGGSLGDRFRGALGFGARGLFQDGVERFLIKLANCHHVDHRSGLVGGEVGEWMNIAELIGGWMNSTDLVSEFAPEGVLVGDGDASEPKGYGH